MTGTSSTHTDLKLVGSRAREWLRELQPAISGNAQIPLEHLLQWLVGCWTCEWLTEFDTGKHGVQSAGHVLKTRLDLEGQKVVPLLLQCDAALVLVSAGILRTLGIESTVLDLFVSHVSDSLQAQESIDQSQDAELFATRFILNRMDLCPAPAICRMSSKAALEGTNLFLLDEPIIRVVAAEIAAATAYGERAPMVEPTLLTHLTAALPVWTLYYLRKSNLELGSLLIRTLRYLNLTDYAFQTSLDFIVGQQQTDGRFGFLAPEISHLRSLNQGIDEIFDVYLPLSVSCLWAIAEGTLEDFVLFRSIGR